MGKGIFKLFLSKEKHKKKAEECQDHTEQISVTQQRVIECSSCGAKKLIISNSGCECEYCRSPLVNNEEDKAIPSVSAANAQNVDLSNTANTYTLSTGFYTAGIDIPVGKCNVTAISGCGNLYSSDDGINESFGIEKGFVSSFKGLKLPKDIPLIVYGHLTIKIVYRSVDDGFSGRTYDTSSAIDLSTGNYEVGIDFKAGTYNIVAVSGMGNLYSDDGDVNEVFGIEDSYVREIKNVYLPEAAELSIEGCLSVKLIPECSR